jgi:hypothetical protein
MKTLISSALAAAMVASLGPVAVYAKEPPAGRTASQRMDHHRAMRYAGHVRTYASQSYINVWGSRVRLDRGGF